MRLAAITIDLHVGDEPSDIAHAAQWLAGIGVRATFFVPSTLFQMQRYHECLRALPGLRHEVGSHSHLHDAAEMNALGHGDASRLAFLDDSKRIFEDFYGFEPRAFRSPAWCFLGHAARDELQRLGYAVDSSATPQRLAILGSRPGEPAWTFAPRRPHYLRPGLLEIPTSSCLIPASCRSFRTLRRVLSLACVRMLLAEAWVFDARVVTLQFHPDDFNPDSVRKRRARRPLQWSDLLLRRQGGFAFKNLLKETDYKRIAATAHAVVSLMRPYGCVTLSEIGDVARKRMALRGERDDAAMARRPEG